MAKPLAKVTHPNLFQLHGDGVFVAYSTSGFTGALQLSYQDPTTSRSFSSDEIGVVETQIGQLVTVTIAQTPDLGSTDFTLFIPTIQLGLFETVQIFTLGVTTLHRTTIIGPPHGQSDFYRAHDLAGSASFVEF